jgi:hypothetical protein
MSSKGDRGKIRAEGLTLLVVAGTRDLAHRALQGVSVF